MRGLRKAAAAVSLTLIGTGGLGLAVAGPAAAVNGGSVSLDCTTGTAGGQPSMSCTATSRNGGVALHFAKVADLTSGTNFVVGTSSPCNQGGITNPQTLSFPATPGHKYKVIVTNCTGNKDVFKVAPDGTVTVIKSV
jgi:hypothetical protein